MEAAGSSELLVIIWQTTQYHISGDCRLHIQSYQNPKSHNIRVPQFCKQAVDLFRESTYALKITWFLDTAFYIGVLYADK